MLNQGYEFRPITIADHATVTTKCTIIADLGERVFVGANSVVTKAVPAFSVAAGVPAKVIEYFGPDAPR
jgi:acetyltransferase-like isoleucine patch superfamily enzyme